jgi:zinc protease
LRGSSESGRSALTSPAAPAGLALPTLPGELTVERLDNGLTVALLASPQAPVVTTALWYRAGTRDEAPGHGGEAHFLEHMMFKGSSRFGPGEVDRRTQVLGGANNAFTSHDATTYYFQLAADRWTAALEMEADRMAGLTLGPREVDSERRVILEEIAMYEDDPWDSLTQAVEKVLYRGHPYGRPVLGRREELLATGAEALRAFHRRLYRPDNAVLVVGGDLGRPGEALEAVDRAFGALESGAGRRRVPGARTLPSGLVRITRRKGEVPRLLLSMPAPAVSDPDFPALRLATAVLGLGRSSRLFRTLVDERQVCSWVSTSLTDALDPGAFSAASEVVPGCEPERVEDEVLRIIAALGAEPPSPEELERAREMMLSDWTFGHERISQQTLTVGSDLTFFDAGWSEAEIARIARVGPEDVGRVAERWLTPRESGVLGWSLPANGTEAEGPTETAPGAER